MGVRLDKLLGKSPFGQIQDMMVQTNEVSFLVAELFQNLTDLDKLTSLSQEISLKEGQIDEVKDDIRHKVGQSLFFPLHKRDFLDLIYQIDGISDRAESLAALFSIRVLSCPENLHNQLKQMLDAVLVLREYVSNILIDELPGLVEASFSGPEALAVGEMIQGIGKKAHDLEALAHQALRIIFSPDSGIDPVEVILWNKIIDRLESVGLAFEKTATALRRLMEK